MEEADFVAEAIDEKELETLSILGDDDPFTKLLYFAKKNDWDGAMQLLSTHTTAEFDHTVADKAGFNTLLLAVRRSKIAVVEKLIEKGADLFSSETKVNKRKKN
jgi:ankyrin repeat protein